MALPPDYTPPLPAESSVTLASLREQTRALFVDIARFRASTESRESEYEALEEASTSVAKTLGDLDKLLKARHSTAAVGS